MAEGDPSGHVITIFLGYVAARHHEFNAAEAPTLTRMVMTYALPLAIFVGTVTTTGCRHAVHT